MRILYIDIDSCRPDHLGCYGYHRHTSPNIDNIARKGKIFNNCYVSDSPCLPSRTALFWAQFGYRSGVVNHSGMASQFIVPNRGFHLREKYFTSLPSTLAQAGYHTCSISSFMDRHSAWHVTQGFREIRDNGHHGHEIADEVSNLAIPWLQENASKKKWFLHVNFWDPHRPYQTPESWGNPFKHDPPPAWPDKETIKKHFSSYGPYSASEPLGHGCSGKKPSARETAQIRNLEEFKHTIDGYDCGIRYADHHIGQLFEALNNAKVLDDTLIIISADHGECQGEHNTYGGHIMANHATHRVPLIMSGPGVTKGKADNQLIYQFDLASTLCQMTGAHIPDSWDSLPFTPALKGESWKGRPYLVLSHGTATCQRSVRTEDWLMTKTYHNGHKPLPDLALYDIAKDPHETKNLAADHTEVVRKCFTLMDEWKNKMKPASCAQDPFLTVLKEGGPHQVRYQTEEYPKYLNKVGKTEAAKQVVAGMKRASEYASQSSLSNE